VAAQQNGTFPGSPREGATVRPVSIRPTVRAVLTRLEPTPALVINKINDVVAWNDGGKRLFGPVGMLDGDPPNITRYLFTDPRAREAFPDWDSTVDASLLQLKRAACPETDQLVAELAASVGPEVTERLARCVAPGNRFGDVPLEHPTGGSMRVAYETMDLSIVEPQYLVVCLPADDHTRGAFDVMAQTP